MHSLEQLFSEGVGDNDAWMAINAKCQNCDHPMVTIAAPMSSVLTGFECATCGYMSVMPLRILMATGIPEKHDQVVTIKSLGCRALEALYQTEANER